MSKKNLLACSITLASLLLVGAAHAQGTMFVENEKVGVNISTPAQEFHLVDGGDANLNGAFRIGTISQAWDFATIENTGSFRISKLGTGVTEFDLGSNGNLTIQGQIVTNGTCSSGCDRVFSPDYKLESIEEHAEFMWKNSHLPAVGPTPESGPFNLSQKTLGVLNEVEKAHIYIDQLHEALKKKSEQVDDLREQNTEILARLAQIEEKLEGTQ